MASDERAAPNPQFIVDQPVPLRTEDAFGHLDYARTIASTLSQAPTPFTFGLFGRWGVGKTSIIEAVRDELAPNDVAFATFDVWRYEGDALRRQFLKDIAGQLKAAGHLKWGYEPEKTLRDLDVDLAVPEESLGFSKRNLLVAGLIALVTGGVAYAFLRLRAESHLGITVPSREISGDAYLSFLLALLAFAGALVNRVFRVDQRVASVRRIEEPERFLQKFEELLAAVKARRLLIAIDNLDRCSPALADQMLATIKTYLEPATPADDKSTATVFLIAVDDAALRRHLVARELEATTSGQRDVDAGLKTAEAYVSEYLRKFFTATIRIKELLDEEMRTYVAKELEHLIEAYELGTEATQLTTMVASGLRQNPRQVKQFANNLEARLRLIRQREFSGRIIRRDDSPISGQVVPVAKLAIIEEEWPDRYRELESDPRLLSEWHNKVIAGGELDDDDPQFAAFLRTTQDVAIPDIYPLLRLRQTQAERELPDFSRFREAITLGALPEAADIVDKADETKRSQYTNRLEDIFDEEVRRGNLQGARNALDAALGATSLDVPDTVGTSMIRKALRVQQLRDELWRLEPKRVLGFRSRLGAQDRQLLAEPFLHLGQIARSAPDRVGAVAEALAASRGDLSALEKEVLRAALSDDSVVPRYSDYAGLARAEPDLLSDRHAGDAYEQLFANSPAQLDSPAAEVLTSALAAGRAPNIADAFVSQLSTIVATVAQVPDLINGALERLTEMVSRIPSVSDSAAEQTLGGLEGQWTNVIGPDSANRVALVNLAGTVADLASDQSDATRSRAAWFADRLFEDPAGSLPYLETANTDMPKSLRSQVQMQLGELVRTTDHRNLRVDASRILLGAEESKPNFQSALADRMARGEFEVGAELIHTFGRQLADLSGTVDSYLASMGNLDASEREPAARGLITLASLLDDEQLQRSGPLLEEMLLSSYEGTIRDAIAAADALVGTGSFEAQFRDLIRAASRELSSTDHDPDEVDLLRWVGLHSDQLDGAERGALLSQTRRWLAERIGAADRIAAAAASIDALSNDQRLELVQSILESESVQGDPAVRSSLLLSANQAKGRTRRAADLIKERLGTLRASSDENDRAVAQAFDDSAAL